MKLRVADLFCGAGGCSEGYRRACDLLGIEAEIVGVDIQRFKRYPFDQVVMDVMDLFRTVAGIEWLRGFDFIHASPPCQGYGRGRHMSGTREHDLLIEPVRTGLRLVGKPYVIENTEEARSSMVNPVTLCGSMFFRDIKRHRLFESNMEFGQPRCQHERWVNKYKIQRSVNRAAQMGTERFYYSPVVHVHGATGGKGGVELWQTTMGIDWMVGTELKEAIPPDYTQLLGLQAFPQILDTNRTSVVQSEHDPATAKDRRPTTSQQETQPVEIQVEAQIREEIAQLKVRLDQADTRTFDLQEQYDSLQAQADKARSDVKKKELQTRADRVHGALVQSLGLGKDLSEKITKLQHPSELERRVSAKIETTERIEKMTSTASKTKKVTALELGVPKQYLGTAGTFKPGMDARYKSDLINAILEIPNPNALAKFTKAEAEAAFKKFPQWQPFLDRKRQIVADRATAAAKKQTEKAEAAKTKASEKKTTAATAVKTSTAKSGATAKPDPKPSSKRSRSSAKK